jgi:hypothetical protein
MNLSPLFHTFRLLALGIVTSTLCGCLSIPTTDNSVLMVRVAAPTRPGDIDEGTKLIDHFAHRYGYTKGSGIDPCGRAGSGYVIAFGYSGGLKIIRAYEQPATAPSSLPYLIDLSEGDRGELFFDITLHDDESAPVNDFLNAIDSAYGKVRVKSARPTTHDTLLIGD